MPSMSIKLLAIPLPTLTDPSPRPVTPSLKVMSTVKLPELLGSGSELVSVVVGAVLSTVYTSPTNGALVMVALRPVSFVKSTPMVPSPVSTVAVTVQLNPSTSVTDDIDDPPPIPELFNVKLAGVSPVTGEVN